MPSFNNRAYRVQCVSAFNGPPEARPSPGLRDDSIKRATLDDEGPGGIDPPGIPKNSSWRGAALGTFFTGGGLAAGQITTGLALLVLARRSSLSSFGLFAALYGASTAVGGLIDFGSSQKRTRELASGLGKRQFRAWLFQRTAFQAPAIALFALTAVVVLGHRLPLVAVLGLSMQAITITLSQGALAAVRALRSPALATWLVVVGNLVLLCATIIAPKQNLLAVSGGAAALSWLVTAVVGLWTTRHLVGSKRDGLDRNPWAGTAGFGIFSLAVAIQGLDVVIVGAVGGAIAAGNLAAVEKWIQPIMLVVAAYSNHVFPTLAAASSNHAAIRLLRPAIYAVGLAVVAAAVVVLGAPWFISVLLGAKYAGSVGLLRFLAVACLPVAAYQPLVTLLQARHQERYLAKTATVASICVLVLIFFLTRRLGGAAVPAAWLIGFGPLCGVLVHRTLRITRLPRAEVASRDSIVGSAL